MAHESLVMLMLHSTGPNLFDTHPAGQGWIFQIDGTLGRRPQSLRCSCRATMAQSTSSGASEGLAARQCNRIACPRRHQDRHHVGQGSRNRSHAVRERAWRLRVTPAERQKIASIAYAGRPIRVQPDPNGDIKLQVQRGGTYRIRVRVSSP